MDFQFNEISDLPANVFTPLKKLRSLGLRSNKLTTIHSDSFNVHNNLTRVSLDCNEINAIDENFIDNAALSFIDMRNNTCSQAELSKTGSTNEFIIEIKSSLRKCFDNYQPRKQSQIYDQLQVLNRKTESNDSYVESATGQGNITGPTQIVLVIAGKPKLLQFLNQLIKKIFFYFPALLSLQTFF